MPLKIAATLLIIGWILLLGFTVQTASRTFFDDMRQFAGSIITQPAPAPLSGDLAGKVIILDAGHGAEDTNRFAGYDEQAVMLKLTLKLKERLESMSAEVFLTRPDKHDLHLSVRSALINQRALAELIGEGRGNDVELDRLIGIMQSVIDDPDTYAPVYFNFPFDYTYTREIHEDLRLIFEYQEDPYIRDRFLMISLHSNATGRPVSRNIRGVDIFHISNDISRNATYFAGYSNTERNLFFAETLMDAIDNIGLPKRRIQAYHYFVLREHNLPAVLVENGFHTNVDDREKLMDDDFLDELANVYAETIVKYFNSIMRFGSDD